MENLGELRFFSRDFPKKITEKNELPTSYLHSVPNIWRLYGFGWSFFIVGVQYIDRGSFSVLLTGTNLPEKYEKLDVLGEKHVFPARGRLIYTNVNSSIF